MEDSTEITVTIKLLTLCNAEHKEEQLNQETSDTIVIELLTSCNAEHMEKQVNKETSDMIVINAPTPNMQYSKSFGTHHFPPHYMTSELLINQSLQEGVSSERQRMLYWNIPLL